jgi:hypothetical protein
VLLLLAAALLKPALGYPNKNPAAEDPSVHVRLPSEVSTIESQSLLERQLEQEKRQKNFSLNTSFFSRPDLRFSDSFARSQKFGATAMPAFDLAVEQPKLWRVGDAYVGIGTSFGLSTWTSSASSQNLYEIPGEIYARSDMAITKHLHLFSRLGVRGSIYWTNYSTQFSSFSGWGRGLEASAGLEFPFKKSVASLAALVLREARENNSTKSIGMKIGWGFTL